MKLINWLVIISFIFSTKTLYAENFTSNSSADLYQSRISEYFYRSHDADILRPVKLLGEVSKPGVYHLPKNTSLTTLLSISGGTTSAANIEDVVIKTKNGKTKDLDLEDTLYGENDYILAEGDLVYIPAKKGLFDSTTSGSIYVITTILSVLLTGYLVIDNNN